ncbi:MAG: uracil-DNA glycosylase [Gemmatimonadales bacterium]
MSLKRRYLEQQIELGGAELVVSSPLRPEDPQVAAPVSVTPPPAELPVPQGEAASDESPEWLRDAPPIPGPGITVELPQATLLDGDLDHLETLEAAATAIAGCTLCPLSASRNKTVPGEGDPHDRLMLVGEGQGANEDASGRPFVGAAGELLNGILKAINISRESVFIANIVKCRPPQNRKPLPDEVAACLPYLQRQVALIRPKVILALGGTAAENLLGVRKSLGQLRGQVHSYGGIPLVVTYHPAALLRNPNWKKPTWDDVRIARQLLDR